MRLISVFVCCVWALAQAPSHTVAQGDTLFSVAKRYKTSVQVLLQLNNMTSPALRVGQTLKLPTQTPAEAPVPKTPTSTPLTENPDNKNAAPSKDLPAQLPEAKAAPKADYKVQTGDTLFSIARRFGSSVDSIRQENNLSSTTLSVGQAIKVPQWFSIPSSPPQSTPKPKEEGPGESARAKVADAYNPNHPLVGIVVRYLGTPYVFGSNSERAVDCSAFTQQVFADYGVKLPRTSRDQWAAFADVKGGLQQGDLVFFSFSGKQIDHVGVYLGRGVFAHANSYGSRVVIESLDSPYYKRVYRGARRVPSPNP
jgi:cell wall-associated NlpC family hydrolase